MTEHTVRHTPEFGTSADFFASFTGRVALLGPDDHVVLTTMAFEPSEPVVAELVDELSGAASRGARVSIGIDAYSFMIDGKSFRPGPFLLPGRRHIKPFAGREQAITMLRSNGADVQILNRPLRYGTSPLSGRSHIKMAAIQHHEAYIVGANLQQTDRTDNALTIRNSEIAGDVFNAALDIIESGSVRRKLGADKTKIFLSTDDRIMFDAGIPRQSEIYQEALTCVDGTQKDDWLVYASQYYPRGKIAEALGRAYDRKVSVSIIHNAAETHDASSCVVSEHIARRKLRNILPNSCFKQVAQETFIHSKLIATNRQLITGSHNFDPRGVKFGTAEVAYVSHDPQLSRVAANILLTQNGFGLLEDTMKSAA